MRKRKITSLCYFLCFSFICLGIFLSFVFIQNVKNHAFEWKITMLFAGCFSFMRFWYYYNLKDTVEWFCFIAGFFRCFKTVQLSFIERWLTCSSWLKDKTQNKLARRVNFHYIFIGVNKINCDSYLKIIKTILIISALIV